MDHIDALLLSLCVDVAVGLATAPERRPLKSRRNIILSTQDDYQVEGAEVAHNLEELLALLRPEENTFVIDGESIYRLLLPYCKRARATKSYVNLPADRFFPNLDEMPNWQVENTEEILEENGVTFQYLDYVNFNFIPLPI